MYSQQELGFEGVDKFADKYHDQVYDHLPARKKKRNQEEKQNRENNRQNPQEQQSRELPQEQQDRSPRSPRSRQNQQQPSSRHPDKGYPRPRSAPSGDKIDYEDDPEMYAPDRRQERDYRGASDERYREDERSYYNGPDAGAVVPRGHNDFNQSRGYGVAVGHCMKVSSLKLTKNSRTKHLSHTKHPLREATTKAATRPTADAPHHDDEGRRGRRLEKNEIVRHTNLRRAPSRRNSNSACWPRSAEH